MFAKAEGRKLYEEVVGQIKHLINTQQLKNGELLPSEEELSKQIGVGRSTVREALRVLELMGLVETKRGKGTIVKSTDIDNFNNTILQSVERIGNDSYYVYEVDRILEPSIAKLVATRAGDETLKELEGILNKMKENIARGGTGETESLAFHKAIYSALNNPFLNTIFELTKDIHKKDRETVFSITDRGGQTYEEHRKIFEAIKERDGDKAYRYMDSHLAKVGRTFDKLRDLAESN